MGLHGDDEKIPVLTPNKNESNIVIPVAGATAATKGTHTNKYFEKKN